jgi:hypothetical protein
MRKKKLVPPRKGTHQMNARQETADNGPPGEGSQPRTEGYIKPQEQEIRDMVLKGSEVLVRYIQVLTEREEKLADVLGYVAKNLENLRRKPEEPADETIRELDRLRKSLAGPQEDLDKLGHLNRPGFPHDPANRSQ